MDQKIHGDSINQKKDAWNPTPEDQRRFELATSIIEIKAKLEIINAQVVSWKAQQELLQKQLELKQEELHEIRKGQLVLL